MLSALIILWVYYAWNFWLMRSYHFVAFIFLLVCVAAAFFPFLGSVFIAMYTLSSVVHRHCQHWQWVHNMFGFFSSSSLSSLLLLLLLLLLFVYDSSIFFLSVRSLGRSLCRAVSLEFRSLIPSKVDLRDWEDDTEMKNTLTTVFYTAYCIRYVFLVLMQSILCLYKMFTCNTFRLVFFFPTHRMIRTSISISIHLNFPHINGKRHKCTVVVFSLSPFAWSLIFDSLHWICAILVSILTDWYSIIYCICVHNANDVWRHHRFAWIPLKTCFMCSALHCSVVLFIELHAI